MSGTCLREERVECGRSLLADAVLSQIVKLNEVPERKHQEQFHSDVRSNRRLHWLIVSGNSIELVSH